MRAFGFILVLALVIAGYTATAHAFGLAARCPMAAHDCCDKGKPMPLHCLKGDCCPTVAAPALPPASGQMAAFFPAAPVAAALHFALADFNYPQLRPPNAFA